MLIELLTVHKYYLLLIELFTTNHNYVPLLIKIVSVNNYHLPLTKLFTINKNVNGQWYY